MGRHSETLLGHYFPDASGCYIIRHGGRVLYVGQSRNLKSRWQQHQHRDFIEKNLPDAVIEIVLCEESQLLQKEAELIEKLRPMMNGVHNSKFCKELGIDPDWWMARLSSAKRRFIPMARRQ